MQKAHDASKNDYWRNKPLTSSPINQDNLNRMETSMDVIDDRVVLFDTTKANQSDLLLTVKTITYTKSTGTFTFTHFNGTETVINTDLEKLAINFDFDDDPTSPHYQQLIIELDDGTYKYVDLSALITEYEFTDSGRIHFSVNSGGDITADIIDGSITGSKLQPNYLADCVAAKNAAETAESGAETKALVAEGWAVGTQNGTPVTSESPYYENSAKYWADNASNYYRSFSVPTTAWVNNPDQTTAGTYPHIAVITTQYYTNNSRPIWQMNGVGTIPTAAEYDEIKKILEAVFTASGVTLYATALPASALVLEVKGA